MLNAQTSQPAPAAKPAVEFTVQTGHTAEIQGLEYAANGKFFVSAGKDSTIKLWSPAGTLIRTIRTGFWVNYLALSHDSLLLLAASRTGTIYLLSLVGQVIHRFPAVSPREGFISAVAISDDVLPCISPRSLKRSREREGIGPRLRSDALKLGSAVLAGLTNKITMSRCLALRKLNTRSFPA